MLPASFAALMSLSLLAPDTLGAASREASPAAVCDRYQMPASIGLEPGLEPVVRWTLTYSPTFRQQCRVLASMPRLTVNVRVAIRPRGNPDRDRARAIVRRSVNGALSADIEIRDASEITELLAHELEHLIEQIDGVDLGALARHGSARQLSTGAYETTRAIAAGRRVAGEVVDNAPDRMRAAGASMWRSVVRLWR